MNGHTNISALTLKDLVQFIKNQDNFTSPDALESVLGRIGKIFRELESHATASAGLTNEDRTVLLFWLMQVAKERGLKESSTAAVLLKSRGMAELCFGGGLSLSAGLKQWSVISAVLARTAFVNAAETTGKPHTLLMNATVSSANRGRKNATLQSEKRTDMSSLLRPTLDEHRPILTSRTGVGSALRPVLVEHRLILTSTCNRISRFLDGLEDRLKKNKNWLQENGAIFKESLDEVDTLLKSYRPSIITRQAIDLITSANSKRIFLQERYPETHILGTRLEMLERFMKDAFKANQFSAREAVSGVRKVVDPV